MMSMFIVDFLWDINLKEKDGSTGPIPEDRIPMLGEMFANKLQYCSNYFTKKHFKLQNIAVEKIEGSNKLIVSVTIEDDISNLSIETIDQWIQDSLQTSGRKDIVCFYDKAR